MLIAIAAVTIFVAGMPRTIVVLIVGCVCAFIALFVLVYAAAIIPWAAAANVTIGGCYKYKIRD